MGLFVINGETLTDLADKIRTLLGISGTMSTDAMKTNLEAEKTNIANAFTAVGNKGGAVPSSKVSGNLSTAINSIPEGVTVQVKTGTVTGVSGYDKTVTVGFKPDAVLFTGTNPIYKVTQHAGAAFTAGNTTSTQTFFCPPSTSYILSYFTVTQTSTGFKVKGTRIDTSGNQTSESNRSLSYIAVKYTE